MKKTMKFFVAFALIAVMVFGTALSASASSKITYYSFASGKLDGVTTKKKIIASGNAYARKVVMTKNKIVVYGTVDRNNKLQKYSKRTFKLTSKTKYRGYEDEKVMKYSKKTMKKKLNSGKYIGIIIQVKNGKTIEVGESA